MLPSLPNMLPNNPPLSSSSPTAHTSVLGVTSRCLFGSLPRVPPKPCYPGTSFQLLPCLPFVKDPQARNTHTHARATRTPRHTCPTSDTRLRRPRRNSPLPSSLRTQRDRIHRGHGEEDGGDEFLLMTTLRSFRAYGRWPRPVKAANQPTRSKQRHSNGGTRGPNDTDTTSTKSTTPRISHRIQVPNHRGYSENPVRLSR